MGIALGRIFKGILPEDHLSGESHDVIKLSNALIASLSALVLGLLVASANESYKEFNDGVEKIGVDLLSMDHILKSFGPEALDTRDNLHEYIIGLFLLNWPEDKAELEANVKNIKLNVFRQNLQPKVELYKFGSEWADQKLAKIGMEVLAISAKNDSQRWLQSKAMDLCFEIAQERWLLMEQTQETFPPLFLAVMSVWLTILFFSFSLFAPRNKTVATMLLLCALSVSGAVLLFLELNEPFRGLLKASSAPLFRVIVLIDKDAQFFNKTVR
jgi:hypothetical protein